MTYETMLAGRSLAIGDQVICGYRMPSDNQWWIHPFWVGVIEDVGRDVESWNGHNTQEHFCTTCHYVKVRYLPCGDMAGFTQLDSLGSLRQLHFGDVAESPYFASDQKFKLWEFACKSGIADSYADVMRFSPSSSNVGWIESHASQEVSTCQES